VSVWVECCVRQTDGMSLLVALAVETIRDGTVAWTTRLPR
jgi:hypothetical protein